MELLKDHNPLTIENLLKKSAKVFEGIESLVLYVHSQKFDERNKNLFYKIPIAKKHLLFHKFDFSSTKGKKYAVQYVEE